MKMNSSDARRHARRHNRLEIKLSDEELALIEKKAKTAKLSKSAYLRRMGTVGEIKIFDTGLFSNVIQQIRYIGNNINQIAKNANSTGTIGAKEIEKVIDYQKMLQEYIERFYEKLNPTVI